jgi:hypothetical protein
MKTHRIVLFAVLILHVLLGRVMGQWVQMTPNYGQEVLAFAEQGTNLFAGTDNGVFLSTDNGTSWEASGLTGSTVEALDVIGGNVFAGTANGIYVSVNGGGSWSFVGMSGSSVTGFAVVGSKVFVATYGGGVYAGMGIDTNWTPSGLSSGDVTAIDTLRGDIFVAMWYGGVLRSSDDGNTWQAVNSGLTTSYVSCLLVEGPNIYAGTINGLVVSSDLGSSWRDVCGTGFGALTSSGGNLIAAEGIAGGVFLSTDQGTSWVQTPAQPASVQSLATFGTSTFAGTTSGAFRSTDDGVTWQGVGLVGKNVGHIAASGNSIYVGYLGGGVFLSTDEGERWIGINRGLINSDVDALVASGTNLFAGTEGIEGQFRSTDGIFRTTDGGSSWGEIGGLDGEYVLGLALSGPTMLAGTGDGVYVSSDTGLTWKFASEINAPFGHPIPTSLVAIDGGLALAAMGAYGVYVSTDGGRNWSVTDFPDDYANAVGVKGKNLYVCSAGVKVSADSGATWHTLANSPGDINEFTVDDSELFAATYDSGVFISSIMGAEWTNVSDGLADLDITSLCVNNGYLFAVDDSSRVWRRPLSEMVVGVKAQKSNLPSTFSLSQNFPNPFNPSTVISYQVPTNSIVTLKVYDILGREIETLVNGRETAGTHSVTFDGARLPSGVYFCKLTAPGVSMVKKMLLEK